MATKDPTKDNLNSGKEKYEINKLESFIEVMKKKVQEKDRNIDIRNSEIIKLRKDLENKDAEIKEKKTMIRNLDRTKKVAPMTVRMRMKEYLEKKTMKMT